MAKLGADARAEGERQRAQERRHGRHHDRAEAQQRRLVDRLLGWLSLRALGVQREVDHHDGVLLDDADQQDDPDERDHAEVDAADEQRQDRADAGRGQRREDRDRVDVALVEHAEHDVDGHERGEDEQRLVRERGAEGLRRALEAPIDARGKSDLAGRPLDEVDAGAERRAGRQVERQRHRRKLPLVAHEQRRARPGRSRDRGERHMPARRRRDVYVVEVARMVLEPVRDLEHDAVLVQLRENGRDLPLAERVVERVVDELG